MPPGRWVRCSGRSLGTAGGSPSWSHPRPCCRPSRRPPTDRPERGTRSRARDRSGPGSSGGGHQAEHRAVPDRRHARRHAPVHAERDPAPGAARRSIRERLRREPTVLSEPREHPHGRRTRRRPACTRTEARTAGSRRSRTSTRSRRRCKTPAIEPACSASTSTATGTRRTWRRAGIGGSPPYDRRERVLRLHGGLRRRGAALRIGSGRLRTDGASARGISFIRSTDPSEPLFMYWATHCPAQPGDPGTTRPRGVRIDCGRGARPATTRPTSPTSLTTCRGGRASMGRTLARSTSSV